MNIRFAGLEDIPALLRLLEQVGQVHHQIRPDLFRAGARKYDRGALEALLKDENRPIFVAEDGGRVLGYAFCIYQQVEQDPVLADRKSLYVDDLCVDEHCRGQGIATGLYDHVCGYARARGCQAVTLNLWWGNEPARQFYESRGMRPQKMGMEYLL